MKTAIISGAGSGIGQAIAYNLAASGHRIVILELTDESGSQTAERILADGGDVTVIACNVADTQSVESAFEQIESVDVLVNNAGIASIGNVENCSPDELDRVYDVNVKGVYHCLYFAIPKLIAGGGGAIVNLASIASKIGIKDRFAYSMSKGAVLTMTLSIARDYIDQGIRCNCVCPARVHTPFVDGYLNDNWADDQREAVFQTLSDYQPIGRMGKPAEIAELVGFLCSDQVLLSSTYSTLILLGMKLSGCRLQPLEARVQLFVPCIDQDHFRVMILTCFDT